MKPSGRKAWVLRPLKFLREKKSEAVGYPIFPPPTPEELLAHPNMYCERLFQRVSRTPHGEPEDTALFALYRLYEHLILNDNLACGMSLNTSALLVEAFNERISLGLPQKADSIVSREELEQYQKEDKIFETVPEWTNQVPRLEQTLVIPHDNDEVLESMEDVRASAQLAEKNILHWQPHIHFI